MRKLLIFSFILASTVWGRDYYISNSGKDTASGLSVETPLKTLARIKSIKTHPGDRILLDATSTFYETLLLQEKDSGSKDLPVTVNSYGEGKAKIIAINQNGIVAMNTANIVIENISVEAQGNSRIANGIWMISTQSTLLANVSLKNLSVSGFKTTIENGAFSSWQRGNGILIDTQARGAGFHNLSIDGIESTKNSYAGINVRSSNQNYNSQLRISNSLVHGNPGIRGSRNHSGNGIVVSQSREVIIEANQAYDNGENNEANGGPVGIWAWSASEVIIRKNKSYQNRTSSGADGGGFDFDGGVTNSVIEENTSWGNDGAGYLLCTYPGSDPVQNVRVRNNVSLGDGVRNNYGALTVSGNVFNSIIENNRVEVYPQDNSLASGVLALYFTGANVLLKNNQFLLKGGSDFSKILGDAGLEFENNEVNNDLQSAR